MWFKLTNDKAYLFGPHTPTELAWLRAFLTFGDVEADKDPNAKEQVSLFNVFDQSFPVGMLDLVKREARKAKPPVKIEVADTRVVPCQRVSFEEVAQQLALNEVELRPYQVDALEAAIKAKRGVLQLPTGAGKTNIAVALMLSLPCRWLFLVDSADLVKQGAERYRKLTGRDCGMIAEGKFTTGDIVFATFQSVHSKLETPAMRTYLQGVQGVLVDECHTVAATTFYDVLGHLPNAYYRTGLSATPLSRLDRKSILTIARLGSVVFKMTPGELAALGYIAEPRVTLLEVHQAGAWGLHYSVFRERYVVKSRRRNAAVLEGVTLMAKPGLVFFKEEEHGHMLTKLIREELELSCEMVWGEKSTTQREAAIKKLERRDIDIIVCSSVFTKGVDIPFLMGGVNAAGGKSVIDTLQRIGRGLRLSDGKRFFDWIDIADTGHKWLADHTADREATYKLAGYATKRVPSLKAQAIPDFDAKKGKERLTSASQVKWSSGGLDDLET